MNSVLITGINGQVGSYLAEFYLKKGWEVHGFARQRADLSFLKDIEAEIHLHIQDIRDPHGVWAILHDLEPDIIHHLAAMSYVPYSWTSPIDTFSTNVLGTINILEGVRGASPDSILHFAGSSEEYGIVTPDAIPLKEDSVPQPGSPYGVSKYTGDLLCQQYARTYGLKTKISRAFNHTSPRRGKVFASMQIAMQTLEIKHGKRTAFTLGNLSSVRDFTDCRDTIRAYYEMVTNPEILSGKPYNICTGKGFAIRDLIFFAVEAADLPAVPDIEQDPARMRPSDLPILVGDPTRFKMATGWEPQYTMKETMRWIIETLEKELY